MRLTQINQGQHHENECLQSDNQNVEYGPHRAGNQVPNEQHTAAQSKSCVPAQQGNQHKDQLASKQVPEQTHAMRNGFSQILNNLHREVYQRQNHGQKRVLTGAKRRRNQLMPPATPSFDFDVVVKAHQQHRQRRENNFP